MLNKILEVNQTDLLVFLVANLINLILVVIFLARPFGWTRVEQVSGWISITLVVPLLSAVILNIRAGREWWTIVLPVFMILFLMVELGLDYIYQVSFRSTWLLWPYLLLFYFSQWMLIGYSFLIGNLHGAITLMTYFLCMGATIYSYSRVGHGRD